LVQPLKRKGYLDSIRFDLWLTWTQLSPPHPSAPVARLLSSVGPAAPPPHPYRRMATVLSAAGRIQPAGRLPHALRRRPHPARWPRAPRLARLHRQKRPGRLVHQQAGPVATRWRCSPGCVPEQFHFTCIHIGLDAAAGFSIQGSDVLFAGRDFLLKLLVRLNLMTSMQCLTSHMI
jgi:hypothetical protein